jgi:GNAT superfamily N-acetyltransferase
MDGPINFGENDNNWGLLVKGFTQPAYGMSYNPKYYQSLFEDYGFEPLYEQYTNHYNLKKPLPERFRKIGRRVLTNPQYQFKHFKLNKVEAMLKDLETIYNQAWKNHQDFQPIDYDYLLASFRKMKSFLKEDLIWFAYANEEPIGFIVSVPDINQYLKPLKGELNFLSMLKLGYYKVTHKIDRLRVLIMGIVPAYQNKGIESALITHLFESASAYEQYREAELSWVGSFNPKMLALHKASGATHGKTHTTYRYHFEDRIHKT